MFFGVSFVKLQAVHLPDTCHGQNLGNLMEVDDNWLRNLMVIDGSLI